MNLFQRTKLAYLAFTGQWEGYLPSRLRDRPPMSLTGQDSTLNFGTREKLLSEARSLCQTHGICTRILRSYANYVVGSCGVQFLTPDDDWNTMAEERFRSWSQNCHWGQTHSFQKLAKLSVISMIRDGDIFLQKILLDGQPYLMDIEADRVGNYPGGGGLNVDEDKLVGGVKLDTYNRPIGYRVYDRSGNYGQFTNQRDLPKSEVLHLFDPLRFDAKRGVTHFAPALDPYRDIKETTDSERAAQKLASKMSIIIRNAIGGQIGRMPGMIQGPGVGTDTDKKGLDIPTQDVGDAAIAYQLPGEEMELFQGQRPADGWFKFAEFAMRVGTVGLDLPLELIWNMAGLTGPAVRFVGKQAERTFRATQDELEIKAMNPAISWWCNVEMNSGRLPFNPYWMRFRLQRPAYPSIDAGRDSAANLAELAAGVNTEERIAEEQGENGQDIRRMRGREVEEKLYIVEDICTRHPKFDEQSVLAQFGRVNASVAVAETKAELAEDAAEEAKP